MNIFQSKAKASSSNCHCTEPFFKKNGEDTFFSQSGESPCPVRTRIQGAGCRIDRNGFLTNCVDLFSVCGGMDAIPLGTCTDRIRQQYFIGPRTGHGRRQVAVNHLAFRITRENIRTDTDAEMRFRRVCRPEFIHDFDPRIQFPP